MPAAAKKKPTKAVNATDIAHKAERWSKYVRDAQALAQAKDQDQELNELLERHADELQPFVEKYDVEIERLEEKAAAIHSEVIAWLVSRPKAMVIESKRAIAKLLKGKKPGARQPDAEKFIARCEELCKDPWPAVNVVIKTGEPILGKNDFEAICSTEEVPFEKASLELK